MPHIRTALFWMHLAAGVAAGAVILVMSVTGVALTYEKQVLEWADRRQVPSVPPSAEARALSPETLLAEVVAAQPGAAPTGITYRADPGAPVTVTFEDNRAVLVNAYTGLVGGAPSPGTRAFFRATTNWHRWLAIDGPGRSAARSVTGGANVVFLGLVLSGLYLWVPRVWTAKQFTQVLWFRRRLAVKARHFNWHNVIGLWTAVPLAVVVAGAVPISYPWANALLFRMMGEVPPQPAGAAARPSARTETPARAGGRGEAGERRDVSGRAPLSRHGLDQAWNRAVEQAPGWRAISARWTGAQDGPFVFTIDLGYGGQPQKRGTLTVDRATGMVTKWETFADLSPARRLRTWLRFAHTGEFYGLAGQTVAGLVSAAGAALVYTGVSLVWRRWWAWMRRRAYAREEMEVASRV